MKAKNIREAVVILASCATILSFLIVVIVPRLFPSPPTLSLTPTPPALSSPSPTPTLVQTSTIPSNLSDILTWATRGLPFINDQLQYQNGNQWSENTNTLRSCQFSGGTYHASVSHTDSYTLCLALADRDSNLQNIAFQVQMTIIQGDGGGLIFRSSASGSSDYSFTICITSACDVGTYGLYMAQGTHDIPIVSGPSAAINTNLKQTNLLAVVAYNSDIYLYINNMPIKHVHDNTFPSGTIGVTAYEGSTSTDVSFSNVQVWKL